jgi:hypothetical protein
MGVNFEQLAGKWFSNNKFIVINICSAAVLDRLLGWLEAGPGWSSKLEHKEEAEAAPVDILFSLG